MPNMFLIHINDSVILSDWHNWPEETVSGFFHEYIHFLQDIMTLRGLNNIYAMDEYLEFACNEIYPKDKGTVKVPILPRPGQMNVYENLIIKQITYAYKKALPNGVYGPMDVTSKLSSSICTLPTQQGNVDIERFFVNTNQGVFEIGTYHIMESMAYLAQKSMFVPMPYQSPDYPYEVVEKLAENYVSRFSNDKDYHMYLFGLCHISLMTSNPAKTLNCLLEESGKRTSLSTNWKNILRSFCSEVRVGDLQGHVLTIAEALKALVPSVLGNLGKRFATTDHQALQNWYTNAINTMCNMWYGNPMILVDMLEEGNIKTNSIFKSILSKVGTPLLANSDNDTYIYEPSNIAITTEQHARFLAAGSIIATLLDGNFKCLLFDYCKKKPWVQGQDCDTAPWKNARQQHPCPFGHLWYGWNLKDYELAK